MGESVLDTLDKVVTDAAQKTTTLQHQASHVHESVHSATTTLSKHAAEAVHHSPTLLQHKAQLAESMSVLVHHASSVSMGGLTSLGTAVGLAVVVAVMDEAMQDKRA